MSSQAVMKRQILALAKREPSNEELQKIKQSLSVYKKLTKEEQTKINEMVKDAHAKLDSEGKFAKGGKITKLNFEEIDFPTENQTEINAKNWLNDLIKERGRKEAERIVRYNLEGKNQLYRHNNIYDTWLASAINNQKFAKGGKTKTQSMKTALTEFKNKIGAKKFKRATTGTDIKKDIGIPAQKVGKRIVRKKGKTTNQYGTFKNQVGTTYYESRPNRSDVNQPSEKRKIKLAKGGTTSSLASIKRKYLKNEDENAHSENVVLLAKHFGDAEDLKLAKQILAKHNKEGHLSSENGKERNELHLKLIKKARAKFGEEGIEFAQGGSVSKGIEQPFYEEGIMISKPFYSEEKSFFGLAKGYKITNKFKENITAEFIISKNLGISKKDALDKANAFYNFCKKAKTWEQYEDLSSEFIKEWNAKEKYAKGGEVSKWSVSDISDAKYLGVIEFQDNQEEYHNFEIMETEDRLVFGSFTNSGFIESGYIEKDGMSTDETLQNLLEDLEVYYNDGEQYTSMIVVNQRMANGGKLRSKAKYIPNRNIDEIEVTRNGKTTSIDGANLLDGVYVKKGTKYGKGGISDSYKRFVLEVRDGKTDELLEERVYRYNRYKDALQDAQDDEEEFLKKYGNPLHFELKEKYAEGGEIEIGSIVNLPEIKMKDGRVQYERVVGGEVIGIEDGIYDVLNAKTNRLHRVTKQQIEQIDQAKAKHTRSRGSLRSNEDTYPKGTEFAKGGEVEKPLSYYKYETPKVKIAWKGKIQPLGMFKSAEEAYEVIENRSNFPFEREEYSIVTPDKVIHLGKEYQIRMAKGGTIKKSLAEFKNKVGASKYREATRGVDIEADLQIPALKKGRRVVTTKGKTSNQYGTFKNQVGSVYYENRPNHYDVNQPSANRKIKLADGGQSNSWFNIGSGKNGLEKIKNYSKENPKILYLVTDDNYSNIGSFYLLNGVFAKKTVANPNYDFLRNKMRLTPKSDVIYKMKELGNLQGYYAQGGTFADGGAIGTNYEIELFFKGLAENKRYIGRYVVSSRTLDKLEKDYSKVVSIDVYDNSNQKPISYSDLENKIFLKSKQVSGRMYAQGGTFADGGVLDSLEGAKVYVADLAEYNDGRLVGKWFNLSDYASGADLMEAIQEMLDEQTAKDKSGEVHEEWAVHDFEGFPRSFYSEYMGEKDFEKLYQIADVANERGIPIDVLMEAVADFGADEDQIEEIADAYYGSVSTNFGNEFKDFAYEYIDSIGSIADAVSNPDFYFDFESFGSDARMDYTDEELEEYGYDELDDTELGERLVDEMGGVDQLGQKTIEMYFDYDKFGRDLEHDFISVKGDNGDYYFFNRNW